MRRVHDRNDSGTLFRKAPMKIPEDMTKEQLIKDLIKLRERIDELAKIEADKTSIWRS